MPAYFNLKQLKNLKVKYRFLQAKDNNVNCTFPNKKLVESSLEYNE